jgi:hypothetical protein
MVEWGSDNVKSLPGDKTKSAIIKKGTPVVITDVPFLFEYGISDNGLFDTFRYPAILQPRQHRYLFDITRGELPAGLLGNNCWSDQLQEN